MTDAVVELLSKSIEIVQERNKTHGNYLENFQHTADLWSAYLQTPIAPAQVGVLMALLKFSRENCGSSDPDHFRDAVGYCALAGAVAGEGE